MFLGGSKWMLKVRDVGVAIRHPASNPHAIFGSIPRSENWIGAEGAAFITCCLMRGMESIELGMLPSGATSQRLICKHKAATTYCESHQAAWGRFTPVKLNKVNHCQWLLCNKGTWPF
jgi:hypothetical protein